MNSMDLLKHVAVIPDSDSVKLDEIAKVSAALQRQVQSHLSPTWGMDATVDTFAKLEDMPIDYWPIIVRDDINYPGAAGIHLDDDGQPFALVQYSSGWSLTASHELLEMLCNPYGNRVKAGASPMPGQGRVNFLVEVCDPSEAVEFGYAINGITVSDFYTPNYFDPKTIAGVRYSWTGAVTAPRQVLKGGYLSWHDPISDEWFQEIYFSGNAEFRSLGKLNIERESARNEIYNLTPQAMLARTLDGSKSLVTASLAGSWLLAGNSKATSLRRQIGRLLQKN